MKGQKFVSAHEFVNNVIDKSFLNIGASGRSMGMNLLRLIFKLCQLIASTPKLGDFIPTDKDGNVLEEPSMYDAWTECGCPSQGTGGFIFNDGTIYDCKAYQEDEARILWEGDWSVVIDSVGDWTVSLNGLEISSYKKTTYCHLTNIGLKFKREL